MRLVLIIITYLLFIPAGNAADFSKYKSTCSDIGFTPDTDPFADCVLKLYKRDKANTAEKNTQERENIDRSNAIERDRQAQIERDKERQAERQRQAHYERERLKLEREIAARKQKRDEDKQNEKNNSAFWLSLGAALTSMSDNMQKDLDKRNDDMDRSYCESDCRMNQNGSQSSCERMCR